ncbi:molybdopterin-dependent oxidoreductase [Halococcoides cellulosivorans]|uniref:Sulfite oxidase n=1 Tax=Halococcoides cellulosivorans TaxID=1679096 RepID=A0A2R4WZG0_9EURY|nr:molybdopterin-dependent oxidoreductase [Halococcoides cellulosivorans]AWB26905.1 sulfite oxidase [Halococcoides cellulosivorans]
MPPNLSPGARDGTAVIAAIAAVAGSYAAVGRQPAFLVAPVERAISGAMPGQIVGFAIETFGSLGQEINFLMATALTIAVLSVLVRLAIPDEPSVRDALAVGVTGVGTWLLATGVTGAPLIAVAAALPAALVVAVGLTIRWGWPTDEEVSDSRRTVLAAVAGGGVGLTGYLVGQTRSTGDGSPDLVPGSNVDHDAIQASLAAAEDRELAYEGLDPLVSEDFYQVSIGAVDPDVDREAWSLSLTGEVDDPVEVDFQDILEMPAENRFVTLRCVSDPLNGEKHDNALWTGVPVTELLDQVEISSDCDCVMLHGADDYFVQFPLPALEESLLAYGMNGNALPRGHGAPLRALVPDRWGEVNTKWITEIEFLDTASAGYWEQRGWNGTGPVHPVAKLHTTRDRADGTRLLGGHAYAGTRGVSRVDVSIDGGDTWAEAELSESLDLPEDVIGPQSGAPHDAWRQWAYTYEPPSDEHVVEVRMVTADGTVQPRENPGLPNSGSFGWVREDLSGR